MLISAPSHPGMPYRAPKTPPHKLRFPGLMAMLICRSLVGDPYIVQDPGDAVASAAFLLSGLRSLQFLCRGTKGAPGRGLGIDRNTGTEESSRRL